MFVLMHWHKGKVISECFEQEHDVLNEVAWYYEPYDLYKVIEIKDDHTWRDLTADALRAIKESIAENEAEERHRRAFRWPE